MEKEKVSKTFSQRLKDLRKNAKMSQDDLAAALGISKGALSYYENMQRVPDIVTLDSIAHFFKVSADYLLGQTKAPTVHVEKKAICDYLGLDEKTTEAIRRFALEYENAQGEFGTVIRSKWFDSFMKDINELAIAMWQKDYALQEERKVDPSKPEEIQNAQFRSNAKQNRVDLIEFRIIKSIYSFFAEYEKKIGEYMGFEAINEPKGDPTHADHNPTEE